MKTHRHPLLSWLAIFLLASVSCSNAVAAPAFSDDFDDGNDGGWLHYQPLGGAAGGSGTWSFPNGAYRLQATGATSPGTTGPARVGSYRTNIFAEFEVQMDLVNWDANLDQLFGVLGRVREPGAGTSDGYAFFYETRFGRGGPGRMDILRISNELSTTLSTFDITLTSGHAYRFRFTGMLEQLKGQIFDLTNSVTPVATLTATDATYTSGFTSLFVYDNSPTANHAVDFTADNFRAGPPTPTLDVSVNRQNQSVTVTWPSWAASFSLNECTNLNAWLPVTSNIQQTGALFTHTNTFGTRRFYRLISQ